MVKQKTYKFRLYPNLEQKILFEKTFGCSRFIWNQMLADRMAHYEETGETLKNTSSPPPKSSLNQNTKNVKKLIVHLEVLS